MKRFVSVLSALSFAAPLLSYGGQAFGADEVYTYTQNGYTMTCTVDENGEAHITDCEGSGTSLVIPEKINAEYAVTAVDSGAFSDLTEIAALIIPDSITAIGSKAFQGCTSLNNVYLGSGVAEIGDYAFSSCPSLESFSVSNSNPYFSEIDGMLCSSDGTELLFYAGDGSAVVPESIISIGKAAFFGRTDITSASIHNRITSVGDYAFAGCTGLTEIIIPDSVTTLGMGSFMNCTGVTYVEIGKGITAVPDDCFSMCMSLESLQMPETTVYFGERAFYCCDELTGIYLPETVTYIGADAFGTHYDILSGTNTPIIGFCIFGTKGTAVHEYAKSSGVDFIDLADPPLGDVNKDGIVDPVDATKVLVEYSYLSMNRPSSFTQYQRIAGDFNRDGTLDVVDASEILITYSINSMK